MNQTRRLAAAALLFAAGCATVPARNASDRLWAGLEAGSHGVGWRNAGEPAIWYPALRGGTAMRLRDYAGRLDELEASLRARHVSDQQIAELLDRRMFARRGAERMAGPFPAAVIVMRSGESAVDYAPLAEFLASHGFLVAAAGENGSLEGIDGSGSPLFLHTLDVTTWTLAADPSAAKERAKTLLAFLEHHPAR